MYFIFITLKHAVKIEADKTEIAAPTRPKLGTSAKDNRILSVAE